MGGGGGVLNPLIIQLSARRPPYRVQILIALQTPTLYRLPWPHRLGPDPIPPFSCASSAGGTSSPLSADATPWWCQSAIARLQPAIVGTRAGRDATKATTTPAHGTGLVGIITVRERVGARGPAGRGLNCVVAKGSGERWKARWWRKAGREGGDHGHVCKVESPWSACGHAMVIHREMPVAIRIRARRSNVRGVENISIDQSELKGIIRFVGIQ